MRISYSSLAKSIARWICSKLPCNLGAMLKNFFRKFRRKSSKSELASDSESPSNCNSSGGDESVETATQTSSRVVAGIEQVDSFKDVSNADEPNLLINKLNICSEIFDFSDPIKNPAEKDVKRQTLVELVDYVQSSPSRFTESMVEAFYIMFVSNLFRVFPLNDRFSQVAGDNDEEEDAMFDPSWSHLHVVYKLLLHFIGSPSLDTKLAKKYVDHHFIARLLDLFDSKDPREREWLKTILHKIYRKFTVHRPFIRKSVSNVLLRFIYETERHNGIVELLVFFKSVISGFVLPLKEEHKIFLSKTLLPLHKPKTIGIYMQQLTYCEIQFIEKDPKLASVVIMGLLKYWPLTNGQKEVMFISELEEILELTKSDELQKCLVPVFRRISSCMNSSHFQVAQRALLLWNTDHMMTIVSQNRQMILPLLISALNKNFRSHWNKQVLTLTSKVTKMFSEMDEELVEACHKRFHEDERKLLEAEERRKTKWEQLEKTSSTF